VFTYVIYVSSKYSDTGVDNVQFIKNVQTEVLLELIKTHVTTGTLHIETKLTTEVNIRY
jgi:hypothetical protein